MSTSSSADAIFLLEWINTFKDKGTKCHRLEDLSSGTSLLECVRRVIPEVCERNKQEPWDVIWQLLEDFCGCSLEQSISQEAVISGDREHIARVAVLLLCRLVQHKPNEFVISNITSLEHEAQHHLMFFIEETLGKVNSDAIRTGNFTSGVGDTLPQFETELALSPEHKGIPKPSFSTTFTGQSESEEAFFAIPTLTPQRHRNYPKLQLTTPRKFLNSPAAVKWLCSPAIFRSTSKHSQGNSKEEVRCLQHRVRVLEKALDTQTKLTQEYYQDLLQKAEEYEELEGRYLLAENKLGRLNEIQDLTDELVQKNTDLDKAERGLERYKSEVDSLQILMKNMQQKCTCAKKDARIEDLEERIEQLTDTLIEKSSELKRLEVVNQTLAIELGSKREQIQRLLQESKESSEAVRDMTMRCKLLEEAKIKLQEEKEEHEQVLLEEKKQLAMKVDKVQTELVSREEVVASLQKSFNQLGQDLEQSVQQEVEYLRCELNEKSSELLSVKESSQALCSGLESRISQLESLLQDHEEALDEANLTCKRLEEAKTQLEEKTTKEQTFTLEKEDTLRMSLASKEGELGKMQQHQEEAWGLRVDCNQIIEVLRQELTESTSEIEKLKLSNETLREKLDFERNSSEALLRESREALREVARNCTLLEDTKAQLEVQSDHKNGIEQDALQKVDDLSLKLQKVQSSLTSKEEQLAATQMDNTTLKEELRQLKQDLVDYKSRMIGDVEEKATSLQSQVVEVRKQLQQAAKQRDTLQDYIAKSSRMKEDVEIDNNAMRTELNQVTKLLVKEQRNQAKLAAENKTLQAQLSYASQKLRDIGKEGISRAQSQQSYKGRFSSRPSTASSVSMSTRSATSYEPSSNKEELWQLHNTTVNSLEIPKECFDDNSIELTSDSDPLPWNTVPPFCGDQTQSRSILTAIPEEEDSLTRFGVLQQRNAKALPHLKSSYPIEMQMQPNSPSTSDECVKRGNMDTKQHARNPPESRLARKRGHSNSDSIDSLCRSPVPSRRRISAPPTPDLHVPVAKEFARQAAQLRRFTMAPSERDYHSNEPDQHKRGTVFEIAFSPPKTKCLPKRLQSTAASMPKPTNRVSTAAVTKSKSAPKSITSGIKSTNGTFNNATVIKSKTTKTFSALKHRNYKL